MKKIFFVLSTMFLISACSQNMIIDPTAYKCQEADQYYSVGYVLTLSDGSKVQCQKTKGTSMFRQLPFPEWVVISE